VKGLLARTRRALADRRWPWFAAALGFLLSVTAWPSGFQLDDFFQAMILRGDVELGNGNRLLDLFTFSKGEPARNRADMASGLAPWWTSPGYRMNFLRPLAAVTHWMDYTFWPRQKWLMHAQCSLWLAGSIAAVGFLFRRLFAHAADDDLENHGADRERKAITWSAAASAGLATLFFALRDEHAVTIAWIANRNLLTATFFGVLAWTLHCLWRERGSRLAAVAAPLCFGLALLSGEAAAAIGGCLFAYALLLDHGTCSRRFASLLPCGLVGVAWFLLYQFRHCGARESGMYLDPVQDFAAYAAGFLKRAPVYLGSSFGFSSVNGLTFSRPAMQQAIVASATCGVAVVAAILFPVVRHDRLLQFFAMCMLLAIAPLCAGLATDRLLMVFNIPASGLTARFIQLVLNRARQLPARDRWRIPARCLAKTWLAVHTLFAAVMLPVNILGFGAFGATYLKAARSPVFDHPNLAHQDLVFISAPDGTYPLFLTFARADEGLPRPASVRMIASSLSRFDVSRPDPCTLVVTIPDGMLPDVFSRMYRDLAHNPFAPGTQIDLPRFSVTVLESAPDGQPTRIACRFPVRLEDTSLCLVEWRDGQFVPFTPPQVGGDQPVEQASHWTLYHLEPLRSVLRL
jgi:hypothetical protein